MLIVVALGYFFGWFYASNSISCPTSRFFFCHCRCCLVDLFWFSFANSNGLLLLSSSAAARCCIASLQPRSRAQHVVVYAFPPSQSRELILFLSNVTLIVGSVSKCRFNCGRMWLKAMLLCHRYLTVICCGFHKFWLFWWKGCMRCCYFSCLINAQFHFVMLNLDSTGILGASIEHFLFVQVRAVELVEPLQQCDFAIHLDRRLYSKWKAVLHFVILLL